MQQIELSDYTIINKNDITFFWQIFQQIEPFSFLDVGMFLKRTGFISKMMKDPEADFLTKLEGVDFFPEIRLPLYRKLYAQIYTGDQFLTLIQGKWEKQYELAAFLRCDFLQESERREVTQWISRHTRFMITEINSKEKQEFLETLGAVQVLEYKDEQYAFSIFY